MFYLLGEKECLRTLLLLTAQGGNVAKTESELKARYFDFVAGIGGPELRPPNPEERVTYDDARIAKIIAKYTQFARLNDPAIEVLETPLEARKEAMGHVLGAIDYLGSVNAGLRHVLELVIHTIFYHRSPVSGGGSVSSAPGVIWCSPRRFWTRGDIAEFLVHELSHNILFLDERRYEHYADYQALADESTYAKSAVRRTARSLDRTFHSLVVASEVLAFRAEAGEPADPGVHPRSADLRRACVETIDSIRAVTSRRKLVTDRFEEIMQRVEASLLAPPTTREGAAAA